MTLKKMAFENIVGKGENAGNQHFLLFPQCFLPYQREKSLFQTTFILSSANAFNLDQSKIVPFGKGLTFYLTEKLIDNSWPCYMDLQRMLDNFLIYRFLFLYR